jgi:hypothetical protein
LDQKSRNSPSAPIGADAKNGCDGLKAGQSKARAACFESELIASLSNGLSYIGCLRPFLALDDLEFDRVALLQALISIARNGAVVDENVRSTITPEEAVPLRIVEPLHCAFDAFHLSLSLSPFPGNGTNSRDIFNVASF